jgi:predicted AlkP superfamily pyrophosphatase or phosphodiesterase
MWNRVRRILLLALVFGTTACAARPAGAPVVLISIDGLKPDYITSADRHGLRVPTLRRLMSEGTYARAVTGVLPTVTYPSHTTLVTGVNPATHGILYNSPFDPLHRNQDGWMWYAEDVRAPTLWQSANRAGFVSSSVDWPVTVGARVTYNIAQYWRATTEDDHKLLRALSTPGLLDEGEKAVGRYPAGYIYTVETDTRRSEFAAWLIAAKHPRIHTSYFSVLDEVEHAHGPGTAEVFATIEAIDGMIDRVWKAAAGVDPDTVICVVSDHGFAPYDRTVSINVALQRAGLIDVDADGGVRHWRAMTWGNAVMVKDRGDTEVAAAARRVLDGLIADPSSGVFRYFDTAEARKQGGFPDAAFVVGVRPGFSISARVTGALVEPHAPAGTHGLLRELPEMDSAFFIAGRGVPRGRVIERIDMRDIAPTLARLAGVELPSAEGRDLFAATR